MKFTSIPQIYRNLNRAVEIFSVLGKYGLANWASRLDLGFAKDVLKSRDGDALARQSRETRIRSALTELGPTFIKMGQILSTRADLVGVELAAELERLQDEAPVDPPEEVRQTIQRELGRPVEELFESFNDVALASASIGQVHRARLKSGEEVVVKVRHTGVEQKVRVDLDILAGLAQRAERVAEFKNYRPVALVAEFRHTLLRELDFNRERRNMDRFAIDFADDATVRIPKSYPELCTARVLTMQYLEGVKLSDACRMPGSPFNLDEIARHGARAFLEMVFNHGFFHADPHPGNLLICEGNVIGLLDYGMVGQLDERLREDMEDMLFALSNRDALHLTSVIIRLSAAPPDLDRGSLNFDVADFVAHYANQPLNAFDLTGAINELTEIIRRYGLMLPSRAALLLKVLVMLEGTSCLANPNFSIMEVIQPYEKKILWRRLSPMRQFRKLRRIYAEFEHLAEVGPRGLVDILEQVQTGKFDVHLDHRGLEPSVNRLALALLASALFLGSSLMLCQKAPPLVGQMSLFGGLGCFVSIFLGLRLLWAIRKSGHLDRRA